MQLICACALCSICKKMGRADLENRVMNSYIIIIKNLAFSKMIVARVGAVSRCWGAVLSLMVSF